MDVADAINIMLHASPIPDDSSSLEAPISSATCSTSPSSSPEITLGTDSKIPSRPGCAVWDIYPAQDADKIREFLKEKFDKTHNFVDPIHSQMFYLDAKSRKELWERKRVVSWRVYQYPVSVIAFVMHDMVSDNVYRAKQFLFLQDVRIKFVIFPIVLRWLSTLLALVSLLHYRYHCCMPNSCTTICFIDNVPRCQQLTKDFRRENYLKAWKEDVLQLYNVLWYVFFFLFLSPFLSIVADIIIAGTLGSQPVKLSPGEKRKWPLQKLDRSSFNLSNWTTITLHYSNRSILHLPPSAPLRLLSHRLLI